MSAYQDESVHLRKYLTGIIGNAPFGIVTLSAKHEVGIINSRATHFLGFGSDDPEALIDANYIDVFTHIPELRNALESGFSSRSKLEIDLSRVVINAYVINIKVRELFNGFLVIIEDITKQAELENMLRHQATHDSLTSLGNRQEFENRVEQCLVKAIKHKLPGAILFIDLDRFKPINDTAGHAAGDELLRRISSLLLGKIRSRDMLARIGGDEFAVLLADCPLKVAEQIAESMRSAVEKLIFVYEKHSFKVGLSIGLAPFCRADDTLSNVVNAADNACQIAKNEGRNRVHVAQPDQGEYEQHQQQVQWLPKINQALADNQFVLFAQEIMPLNTHNTQAAEKHYEILLRLLDEEGKMVSPAVFMPPAERYDLMPQVDRWVLAEAFASMQPDTSYSINLSGQSVSDEKLVPYINTLQKKHHVDASKISFEITETASIQNIDQCMVLIKELKKKGYLFSLDDFGSGLSSFSYLKNMPVDFLKIDGSFVKDIATDSTSYAMVKSINEVGHTMGIKTIAEFVEDKKILAKLHEIGVDYAQGYHVHKPQPLNEIVSAVVSSVLPLKRI